MTHHRPEMAKLERLLNESKQRNREWPSLGGGGRGWSRGLEAGTAEAGTAEGRGSSWSRGRNESMLCDLDQVSYGTSLSFGPPTPTL